MSLVRGSRLNFDAPGRGAGGVEHAKFVRPFGLATSRSPSPLPSPFGRGNTASRAATSRGALDWRKRVERFSLSPRAGAREATLETPMRLRTADELNDTGTVRSTMQGRDAGTTQRVRFATQRRTTLPLPKGEGGVRGKERSKHQCACDRAPFDHRQAVRSM